MYKIGIECESIEDGHQWGVGRIVSKLLEELSHRPELKQEFRFVLYFKSKIPDYPFLDNELFIKKIVLPKWVPSSFSIYYYIWLPVRLWFDRVNLMYFPNYMLPIIFSGKSMVTLTEDVHYEFTKGNLPFQYKLAYRIFSTWAALRATKIVAVLESSKTKIAELYHVVPNRIVTIPNGIEMPNHTSSHPYIDGDYIFYLGQAFPRRHLREVLSAFEKINPKFPDLKLIVVGRDKYNPPIIEDLVKKINSNLKKDAIIYKDYIDQKGLEDIYCGAKAFVYVADLDIEAFGLPPLEALSYGVVPIVTLMSATRLIFGDNAIFVSDPNSVDAIADAMGEALTIEQKRKNILSHSDEIIGKYTWQKHTDRFLEAVREIVKK